MPSLLRRAPVAVPAPSQSASRNGPRAGVGPAAPGRPAPRHRATRARGRSPGRGASAPAPSPGRASCRCAARPRIPGRAKRPRRGRSRRCRRREGCGKGRRARRATWRPDSVRCAWRLGRRGAPANVTNARHAARRRAGAGRWHDPLLHFCDGHAFSVRHQVARPGSLALASLPVVGATLIAPWAPAHRAPRSFVRRCRPAPPSRPDARRRRGA